MVLVNRIEEHEKHKDSLLSKIDSIKETQPTHEFTNVFSDWSLPADIEREYLDEFFPLLDPILENVAKSLGFLEPKYLIRDYRYGITMAWFNQYLEGGEHDWHNHPGCHFTNCYYLELPDEEYKTELIGMEGEIIEYTVREGDVMTCPSWMKHRSKPNGPGRKTIIAFNTNYEV